MNTKSNIAAQTDGRDRRSTFAEATEPREAHNKRTVRYTRPGGSRGRTIKANLIVTEGLDLFHLCILVRGGDAHLAFAGGRKGPVVTQVSRRLMAVRTGHVNIV